MGVAVEVSEQQHPAFCVVSTFTENTENIRLKTECLIQEGSIGSI